MLDRYWRKIESVENNIENSMQRSSILLKLKEYDEKLGDLSKIGNNENNILSNLGKIDTNKNNISSNLNQITDIKSRLPTLGIFKKTYSIKNQSFKFNNKIIFLKLLEIENENNFNVDGKLEINSNTYYKYDDLQKYHHRLQHEYRIFDDKNKLFYTITIPNKTDLDFENNIMLVKNNFYIRFKNNYNKIKIKLYLYNAYRYESVFNLELINENFINIAYLDKNYTSLKIDKNRNNISYNLGKIDTNKNNISSNLGKIDTNKNNISSKLGKIDTN